MKRAKKGPEPADVEMAQVVVDAFLLDNITPEIMSEFVRLQGIAAAEYLRRYPWTRIIGNVMWAQVPIWEDRENHGVCHYCRQSIVTIPGRKSWTRLLCAKIEKHCRLCMMQFLAGHHDGVAPPKPKKVNKAENRTGTAYIATYTKPCADCGTPIGSGSLCTKCTRSRLLGDQ